MRALQAVNNAHIEMLGGTKIALGGSRILLLPSFPDLESANALVLLSLQGRNRAGSPVSRCVVWLTLPDISYAPVSYYHTNACAASYRFVV